MKDNIGNDINVGDLVFCYSGQNKNTIQRVASFRYCNGDSLNGVTEAVNFEGRGWISAVNVVSLNALGVDVSSPDGFKSSSSHDALGNLLRVGDNVLFLHALEIYAEVGIVKSLAAKSCLLSIECNRFGQKEYRKKYEELISLTALGIDNIPTRKLLWEIVE